MKKLRKLYFKLFKRYRRLELKLISYQEANSLFKSYAHGHANALIPEQDRWRIADEEDNNIDIGHVWLERRERITE